MKQSPPRPFSFLLISLYLGAMPLVVGSVLVWQVVQYQEVIQEFTPWEWVLTTVLLTIASILAFTQPTLLAIVYGYFLGWAAVPYVFALNMAAIALVYWLAQLLPLAAFEQYLQTHPKAYRLIQNIRKQELKFIFFAKLSPVLPFALTNFALAISGATFRKILLGGFLGMVPRTLLAIWSGSQARQLRQLLENPNTDLSNQLILIGLVLVSSIGLLSLLTRRFQ